jgi:NADPH:quinone reductase-like Zn-dependent oxidoreductase
MIRKILLGLLGLVVVAFIALAVAVRYTKACPTTPLPVASDPAMQAVVQRCYGGPSDLELATIPKLPPDPDRVQVRVIAAAANPLDWHYMRGEPYIMRAAGAGFGAPNDPSFGTDYAGVVTAVGREVTKWKPGDEVFGARGGAYGGYVNVRQDRGIALKPANVSWEDAAAMPVAAMTALQALRDAAQVQPGQKVLINGASGGVGTYAVQLAKWMGAEVTGVTSTRNVELVRSLGADHVVDYKKEDFTQGDVRYDVILDNISNHGFLALRRVMTDDGVVVIVGANTDDKWLGALSAPLRGMVLNPFVSQRFQFFLSDTSQADLEILAGLASEGKLRSVIDRRYPLAEVPAAITYLEEGRTRGKIIVNVSEPPASLTPEASETPAVPESTTAPAQ